MHGLLIILCLLAAGNKDSAENNNILLYQTEEHRDDRLTIHLSEAVSLSHIRHELGDEINGKVADSQRRLISRLLEIKGVRRVTLNRYRLEIEKGKVFEWKDIRPQVLDQLGRHFQLIPMEKPAKNGKRQ